MRILRTTERHGAGWREQNFIPDDEAFRQVNRCATRVWEEKHSWLYPQVTHFAAIKNTLIGQNTAPAEQGKGGSFMLSALRENLIHKRNNFTARYDAVGLDRRSVLNPAIGNGGHNVSVRPVFRIGNIWHGHSLSVYKACQNGKELPVGQIIIWTEQAVTAVQNAHRSECRNGIVIP